MGGRLFCLWDEPIVLRSGGEVGLWQPVRCLSLCAQYSLSNTIYEEVCDESVTIVPTYPIPISNSQEG
jgi:hypothetical protein